MLLHGFIIIQNNPNNSPNNSTKSFEEYDIETASTSKSQSLIPSIVMTQPPYYNQPFRKRCFALYIITLDVGY